MSSYNFLPIYQELECLYVQAQDMENKKRATHDIPSARHFAGVQVGIKKAKYLIKKELEKNPIVHGTPSGKS